MAVNMLLVVSDDRLPIVPLLDVVLSVEVVDAAVAVGVAVAAVAVVVLVVAACVAAVLWLVYRVEPVPLTELTVIGFS